MQTLSSKERKGIVCAGNWIVDRVKIIDRLPGTGMLGSILSETQASGGSSFNVLVDLGKMGATFPLAGLDVIGRDSGADFNVLVDQARMKTPFPLSGAGVIGKDSGPTLASCRSASMLELRSPVILPYCRLRSICSTFLIA